MGVHTKGALELVSACFTFILASFILTRLYKEQRKLKDVYGSSVSKQLFITCEVALFSTIFYVLMRIFTVSYDDPFSTSMCHIYWLSPAMHGITKETSLIFYALRIYKTFQGSVWEVSPLKTRVIIGGIITTTVLNGSFFFVIMIPCTVFFP